MELPHITEVYRYALPKGGFKFTGVTALGEHIVLRANATRPYTIAAFHELPVVSKFIEGSTGEWVEDPAGKPWASDGIRRTFVVNQQKDIRCYITFHQAAPKARYSDVIIRTLPIQDSSPNA